MSSTSTSWDEREQAAVATVEAVVEAATYMLELQQRHQTLCFWKGCLLTAANLHGSLQEV
jgi:hypothetical protein